ncbi:hypothetical protein [Streptomyces sp. HSG2]|nr:hypothetical protein [Streptomyces sp. HSG2]
MSGSSVHSLQKAAWLNHASSPVRGRRTIAGRTCRVRSVPLSPQSVSMAFSAQYRSTSADESVAKAVRQSREMCSA